MRTGEEITPILSSNAALPIQAYNVTGASQSPFLTSTGVSFSPYPYMWSNQHSIILPHGSPFPYAYSTVNTHGGLYAHTYPDQGASFSLTKMEEMVTGPKETLSVKTRLGNPGKMSLIGGKSGHPKKAALGSGCDATSPSAENGSGGSSDPSNEDANQLVSSENRKRSFSQMLTDASASKNPTALVPATNLNNDMATTRPALPSVKIIGYEGVSHDHQPTEAPDERELKRQRRKESNRESARRSKLRKQMECEELQAKVEKICSENYTLTDELTKLAMECEKLTSENNNIMEELNQTYRCSTALSNSHGQQYSDGEGFSNNANFASLKTTNFFGSNEKIGS